MEELAQHGGGIIRERGVVQRAIHQLHPPIAGALIDDERHVPHAQPRVSTLLDVAHRSAKAADQEVTQALFGPVQVMRGVHRPENVVTRYLRIESANQTLEPFFANSRIHLVFGQFQIHNCF